MASEFLNSSFDLSRKSGLVFDAEGVTLIARCSDEIAAYRTRKAWKEVLAGYFLLEQGRDYETSVLACPENNYFVLSCFFISACGRYAFWRLINDQAPEAELKLSQSPATGGKKKTQVAFSAPRDLQLPAIFAGPDHPSRKPRNNLLKALRHFRKFLF